MNAGRRAEGLTHLRRARQLDPRDEIIARTLKRARRGREIDIKDIHDRYRERYTELGE